MTTQTTTLDAIAIDKIEYGFPSDTGDSFIGFHTNLTVEGTSNIIIQLPELKVYSSGIYQENGRLFIDLLLGRDNKDLFTFMNSLDKHTIDYIHSHSKSWYDRKVSLDIIETYYNYAIQSKNNLPIIKVRLTDDTQLNNADLPWFWDDAKAIEKQHIKKNMKISSTIELSGLSIKEQNICQILTAKTLQTATKLKQTEILLFVKFNILNFLPFKY